MGREILDRESGISGGGGGGGGAEGGVAELLVEPAGLLRLAVALEKLRELQLSLAVGGIESDRPLEVLPSGLDAAGVFGEPTSEHAMIVRLVRIEPHRLVDRSDGVEVVPGLPVAIGLEKVKLRFLCGFGS